MDTRSYTDGYQSPFYNHSEIKKVVISSGVENIGDGLFLDCSGIETVTIPGSVIEIGKSAFENCVHLIKVKFPRGVVRIGDNAFSGCSAMTSITLLNTVFEIGDGAFQNCNALHRVYIEDLTAWLKIDFEGLWANPLSNSAVLYVKGVALTNLKVPSGITEIRNYAFNGCSSLKYATIAGSVTSIGKDAFEECSALVKVRISGKVTEIGGYAFSECKKLTGIVFEGAAPSFGPGVFEDVTANVSYPGWEKSWTVGVRKNYGGRLTWTAEEKHYKISFRWNGGDGGKLAAVQATYGEEYQLPLNTFYRKYYRFTGWNTKADGTGKAFADGATVSNLSATDGAEVILYAQWAKTRYQNYKIVFTKNDPDATGKDLTQTAVNGTSVKLWQNHFTKEGYLFVGWAKSPTGEVAFTNGQTVSYPSINGDAATKVTLYAKWQKQFQIVFNKNSADAVGNTLTQTVKTAKVKLWMNHFTREGYTFAGWATRPNGPVVYKNSETILCSKLNPSSTAKINLYAVWTRTIGSTVKFGNYHGASDWTVVDSEGDKALLVSKSIVDLKAYYDGWDGEEDSYTPQTWATSTLRKWLNQTFIADAFSASEQKKIITTDVVNANNSEYNTNGGKNTQDKVFLLSMEEAKKYFATDADRIGQTSEYAGSLVTEQTAKAAKMWWLRSPGEDGIFAAYIDAKGMIQEKGMYYGTLAGVRPAMWVNLEGV